jgi:AcrR family transcriptional regulator
LNVKSLKIRTEEVKIRTEEVRGRGRPRSFDREAAVDAAMLLFWQHGFEASSLALLTDAMGIRPASLYAAFGSKEGLFIEALERYRSGVGSGLPRVLNTAPTAREGIARLLEGAAAAITNRSKPRGCMIVLSALHGFADSAVLDRELQKCRAQDRDAVAARIKAGIAAGELPDSCNATAMAAFYIAVIQGMSVQARDGASRATLMKIAEHAMMGWPEHHG